MLCYESEKAATATPPRPDPQPIPNYVKFIVSLGKKFAFMPPELDKHSATDEWLRFFIEELRSHSHSADQLYCIGHDLKGLLTDITGMAQVKGKVCPGALRFITYWMLYAKRFLNINRDLLVTTADKGGKFVIIDATLYEKKVNQHLEEFVGDGTYERLPDLSSFHLLDVNLNDCISC